MSDQYPFMNDQVAWDDWPQLEEWEQPIWPTDESPSHIVEPSHFAIAINALAMHDGPSSQLEPSTGTEGQLKLQGGQDIGVVNLNPDILPDDNNADKSSRTIGTSSPLRRIVYNSSTCASCNAPLDNSEEMLNIENPNVYCTRNRNANHLAVSCVACDKKFPSLQELRTHVNGWPCYLGGKTTFRCAIQGCATNLAPYEIKSHFKSNHPEFKYSCAQCGLGYAYPKQLDGHGEETMHAAYVCRYPECGSEATRIGELKRHQLIHQNIVRRHPCPHCRKYRGSNGFKRKDHLRQHIRNYHHIDDNAQDPNARVSTGHSCPFEECDKTGVNAFETEKLLKIHLKKEHPSPYQCAWLGCDRVGTKGWMRERDMVKHMKKVHDV